MTINLETIKHPITRSLIEALQNGDVTTWQSLFAKDAKLFDDGNPRDLRQFTTDALGHERFTSIDKVTDHGLSVTGKFHTEQWGDFVTYFKLTLNDANKITRLDIGQA